MRPSLDHTHRQDAASWLPKANAPETDFPIQNLPFGVFRAGGRARVGVAIGDCVLDLAAALGSGAVALPDVEAGAAGDGGERALIDVGAIRLAVAAETLNPLMALGGRAARTLRHAIFDALAEGAGAETRRAIEATLHSMDRVELLLPAVVGDYTDFYASIHHATNVGSMFRPDNPLLPNYKYVPIGYHGRASSLVPSGATIRRPLGQTRDDPESPPRYAASRRMDYELEVGLFIGPGNALGETLTVGDAADHIFGLVLVNDWSARDIQTWEYQPLGPFLAKSFATTVGPWVVTADALAPFRIPAFRRDPADPPPLPHLHDDGDQAWGGVGITLEVWLTSARMRAAGAAPVRLSRGTFADMYWTPAQLLAHHASNGCNLRPGDLLASGTVSGAEKGSRGCMLELTWRGSEPVALPTGESRRFLEDGDEVTFRGWCERPGQRRIGFGECRGTITAARPGSGPRS